MRVLIAVDGSEGSHEALRQAPALLSSKKDRVCIYYSVPTIQAASREPLPPNVLKKAQAALAGAILEAARGQLPADFEASAETLAGEQDPRRGLSAAADECNADMIAVGARGVSPLKRLLLGSVSRAAVQSARVPVLVARKPPESPSRPFRVLWAHDGESAGDDVGKFLSRLSFPPDTEAHLMTVTESILPGNAPDWIKRKIEDPEIRSWIEQGEASHLEHNRIVLQELNERRAAAGETFKNAQAHVVEGHPSETILNFLRERHIDLVVLGARRQTGFQRLVLGSTSESVLSDAPCSVLVIRETERP